MTQISTRARTPRQATITGVNLHDIVDPDQLTQALADGHVRRQTHPTEPLAILNYTETCAYENAWTPVTLACRGLIYRTDTGEVVARGFTKFFNYGQPGAPTIDLDAHVFAVDKIDGSLGILYPLPSGSWAVATRGSFTSDQAVHATAVLTARYGGYRPHGGYTTLFEIVYPANRIVVDYGVMDDLVLLGAVDNASGRAVPASSMLLGWPGPWAKELHIGTFADALALPPRPNAEGLVVHEMATGNMVKIKQADYVELHRIVTNLTARKVHDWMVAGKPLADFIAPLPDEFHPWCMQVADDITAAVDQREAEIGKAFDEIVAGLNVGHTRKDFAGRAVPHPDKWAMFLLYDGRDIRAELLKRARPEPFLTPTGRTYGEDTA